MCWQQEPHRPWSPPVAPTGPGRGAAEVEQMSAKRPRDDSLMPLVIPVSVPVRQTDSSSPDHEQASLSASWPSRPLGTHDMSCSDYKTSVIVTRRRSLRNSLSESSGQVSSQTDLIYQNINGTFLCPWRSLFLPSDLFHSPLLNPGLKRPINPQPPVHSLHPNPPFPHPISLPDLGFLTRLTKITQIAYDVCIFSTLSSLPTSNFFYRMVELRVEVKLTPNRPKPNDGLAQNRSLFPHPNLALSSLHQSTPASHLTRVTYVHLSDCLTTPSTCRLTLPRPSSARFERVRVFTFPPSCRPLLLLQQQIIKGYLRLPLPNLQPAASCAPVSSLYCLCKVHR